jgi:RNA polymerase sigma-70 factor (ECF subfamily)
VSGFSVTAGGAPARNGAMDPLASQFERYRRHGDLHALGAVFDAVAPRLLPIALHLCGNAADAEDALQQTFVTAIDGAAAFDAGRRLEPWLAGILANVARGAARRRGRVRPEPLPDLASSPDEGPLAAAERAELAALLRTHVDALPAEQRQVLRLRLHHGLEPAAIAEALELPPGTVRMRLHRGLDALRRLLPASLAVAIAGALPASAARGLAAVRAAVLDAGAAKWITAGTAAAAGASSVAMVGGALAMKKLTAVAAVLFVIGAALWWWNAAPPPTSPSRAGNELRAEPVVAPSPSPSAAADDAVASPGERRVAAASADAAPAEAPGPEVLWGVVVDAVSRAPIAGADVELLHRDADEFENLDLAYAKREQSLARRRTDEQGRFRFDVERTRLHRLAVRAAGYPPATLLQRIGGAEVVVALARGATIEGVVRYGGQPVADAHVRVAVRNQSLELASGRTDGGGAFHFADVPAAAVYVQVTSPRFTEEWQALDVVAGRQHHVEIELKAGGTVRGRVVDAETGAPIAGATVAESWTLRRAVRTGADGRFVLGGLRVQGVIPCYVQAPGFTSAARDVVAEMDGEVVFRLARGAEVTGRLVDGAGAAVTDAYVAVGASYSSAPGLGDCDWLPAPVASDGRFAATGLRPELHYWLFVRARGFGTRVHALPRPLASGERHDVGDVRLRPPARLEGRVVDDDGRPIAGVEITVLGANTDRRASLADGAAPPQVSQFEEREAHTDAAGRFCFGALAGGSYRIRARPIGRLDPVTADVELEDGGARDDVQLVIARGLTIAGTVARDASAADHVLWLSATAEAGDGHVTTRVAADGTFRFEGLAEGRYTIALLMAPDGMTMPPLREIEAGATGVRLAVERAATISGRVVDTAGKPVRARVWAHADGDRSFVRTFSTDAEGRFRIEVAPGFRGTVAGTPLEDGSTRKVEVQDVAAGRSDLVLTIPGG